MHNRVGVRPPFLLNPFLAWAVTTEAELILDSEPISETALSICEKEFFPRRAIEDRNMRFEKGKKRLFAYQSLKSPSFEGLLLPCAYNMYIFVI
jgi:hypothetical protein